MTKENSDIENQMALFGLPEPAKPATPKKAVKKSLPPKAVAPAKKKAAPAKKKAPVKQVAPPPVGRRSGLVPEGDIRLTANIREDLHLRLKIAAAKQRTTIGEIIEDLVEKYVD